MILNPFSTVSWIDFKCVTDRHAKFYGSPPIHLELINFGIIKFRALTFSLKKYIEQSPIDFYHLI